LAASNGLVGMVKAILEIDGIDKQKLLGMKDVEGRTPLDIAIEKGEVDVIKTFLKH
jgi:hypothetical protein